MLQEKFLSGENPKKWVKVSYIKTIVSCYVGQVI
jgi:hypothetical protein